MAISFNGTSDYINMGASSPLSIAANTSFSLMCWLNLSTATPSGPQGIVTKGYDGTNTAYFFQVDNTGPDLQLGSFSATAVHGFNFLPYAGTFLASTWYHVYLEYNAGLTQWQWYLNGISKATTSDATGAIATARSFIVGATDVSGTVQNFFSGCLADVALFNGALTSTEVSNLGTGIVRPNTSMSKTLLGYWKLDTVGASQTDFSGNGNTGNYTGTTPSLCGSSPPFVTVVSPPTFTQSPIPQVRTRILAY